MAFVEAQRIEVPVLLNNFQVDAQVFYRSSVMIAQTHNFFNRELVRFVLNLGDLYRSPGAPGLESNRDIEGSGVS